MEPMVIYLLMAQNLLNLKHESKVVENTLCLGNGSKDTDANNTNKTSLCGHVYDFSVDYRAIAVDDILDIHKYLMEKNNMK